MNVVFICSSGLSSFCLFIGTLLAILATRVVFLVALEQGLLKGRRVGGTNEGNLP